MNHLFCSAWNNVLSVPVFISRAFPTRFFQTSIIASSVIFLSACDSSQKNKQELPGTNTVKILMNEPQPVSKEELQRLKNAAEAWYDSSLGRRGFNGGMIVAKNGHIVFEVYNGSAHVGSSDLITDTTSLHIASVSKTITAMAVLKLAQDGKMNIDEEVSKYLPTFNYPGVTVRTLLNHRSGLPNYVYFMEDLGWDKKTFVTNEDVLSYLVNHKEELKKFTGLPNSRFTYCNTNYALLALLIEKVTAKKFGDYLRETFFGPLGMKHTFVYNMNQAATVIPSYDHRGVLIPMNFLDVVYGDKNIYSTPRDLLIWDRALTSGIIFNEKTLAEAYTPYSNEKPGVRNYGLGWRMNIYPTGKKMVYHNGWWHGNNASFIRLMQDTATIIVLGNKYNRGIYHVNKLSNIFSEYLAESDEEETTPRRAAAAPVKKPPLRKKAAVVKKKSTSTPTKKKPGSKSTR